MFENATVLLIIINLQTFADFNVKYQRVIDHF